MQQLTHWFTQHRQSILDDYFTLLRFRSISTDPAYRGEIDGASKWLCDYLHKIGMSAEIVPTGRHPLVIGHTKSQRANAPTLLFYGHYDVQPVDPVSAWSADPFTPTLRDNKVYARGASDNKGQLFYTVTALRALLELEKGHLPVNVKVCFEGEEESGSQGLSDMLPSLKEKLAADALIIVDLGIPALDHPAITLGVRGIITMEAQLTASSTDLHSGDLGGIAYNPNRALVEMLSKLWDAKGKVRIPKFYDDVVKISAQEKKLFDWSFDRVFYQKTFGIEKVGGEAPFSPMESNWIRPTLEINGLCGGYFGEGFKTVIPAKAIAKISCRLVPDQDPDQIGKLVAKHLQAIAPQGMRCDVSLHHGGPAVRGRADAKIALAAMDAYKEVFGIRASRIMSGGSIPIVAKMIHTLDSDVLLMGCALPSDNIHAPNEHFSLESFEKGFYVIAQLIRNMGER